MTLGVDIDDGQAMHVLLQMGMKNLQTRYVVLEKTVNKSGNGPHM